MRINDYRAAAEAFEKVVSENPRDPEALLNLAKAYEAEGFRDKAVDFYDMYLELNPQDAQIAFQQATILSWQEFSYRRPDALKYYAMGLRAKDDPVERFRYAKLLGEKRETSAEAARQFELALKEKPRNAEAHYGAAQAYAWQGELDKALEHLRAAYALQPDLPGLRAFQQDVAHAALPRLDPLVALERTYEARPKNPQAVLDLARAYAQRGRAAQAAELYQRYLMNQPQRAVINFAMAELLRASPMKERRLQSLAFYEKGLAHEDVPFMRLHYAEILGEQEETLDQSIQEYNKILAIAPTHGEAYFGLARALLWKGQVEDAYDNLQRAESLKPSQTGLAEFRQRILATGVARLGTYRQAYASHPADPNAALRVARLYEKMGERDKALDVLHDYRAHHPDAASVLFQIAIWTEHSPWHLRALRYYERGLLIEDNPAMRLRYAQLLGEHQVTSQDAAEEFERVLQSEPGNAIAHLGAARAYAWYGDLGRALYHARRAILYRPDLLEAQEYVAELRQGQESQWSLDTRILEQPGGGEHGLGVFGGSLNALMHVSPAFVLTGGAGGFDYSHQGDEAEGGVSQMGWRYRDHTGQLFEGQAAYYVLGRNENAYTGLIQFSAETDKTLWRWGFQRDLIYDSYLSLVGQEISGQRLGAARSNLFFADFGRRKWGIDWTIRPFGGWVKAESLEPNLQVGAMAGVRKPLVVVSSSSLAFEYQAKLIHYNQDQSGFLPSLQQPFPGGYFSPHIYLEQLPRLSLALIGDWQELRLAAGPPLQYIQYRPDQSGTWQVGGEADLSYLYRFSEQWNLRIHPSYTQITTVYNRFMLEASFIYIF